MVVTVTVDGRWLTNNDLFRNILVCLKIKEKKSQGNTCTLSLVISSPPHFLYSIPLLWSGLAGHLLDQYPASPIGYFSWREIKHPPYRDLSICSICGYKPPLILFGDFFN